MKKLIYIILLTLPCLAYSIMHRVIQDGSGDYTLIQAALDACSPGDTVLVYPGRYYENLIIQTNEISLISLEAITGIEAYIDSTIVDGSMTNPCLRVSQATTGVLIQGLSLTNGLNIGSGGGILVSSGSSSTMMNCKVFGNTASFGGGIKCNGSTLSLSGVSIFENYALIFGGGFGASAATGYVNNIIFDPINRCSIYNNRSGSGQDIYIQNAYSDLTIYLDTFSVIEPTTYYAIYLSQGLNNYEMQFDIQNAHHQEIDSDLFVSPEGDDANDGLSPAAPLKTIHEAIYRIAADSLSQNTVHLLPGTYSRTDNNQVFPIALKSWTIVQGSGMDNTEVIGSPHPLIPAGYGSYDTVFRSHTQHNQLLSDLSISTTDTDNGCAISGFRETNIDLSNLRISGVRPDYVAVVNLWMDKDYDIVWDNVIIENIVTANGGLLSANDAMSGRISNSIFRNATSTFVSGSVSSNALVSIQADRELSFDNCEFSNLTMSDDNSVTVAISGVQFPQQSNNFSFNNCLFSNNTSQGGIVGISSGNNPNVSITNCTFSGNQSDGYNLMVNGNVDITNSIFYNDTSSQIRVNPYSAEGWETTLSIDHSFIKNGYAGIQQAAGNTINYSASNISGNPLFLGGDDIHNPLYYSLSALSPCINSGTPDTLGLFLPPYDLAGNQRVWDGRIDMGCFEFGAPPVANDDPTAPGTPALSLTAYPNPFSVFTNIRVSSLSSRGAGTDRVRSAGITIYNIKGQRVKSIMIDPEKTGEQFIYWDGRDEDNARCSSGIYLVNLILNGRNVSTRKVTFIR